MAVSCPFALPTPIRLPVLCQWLRDYPVQADANVLRNGFTNGFTIGYTGPRVARDSDCLASATEHPEKVQEKLLDEIHLGRIAGPFPGRPFQNLICSPIGLVPKREPNKFRMIHHLSFPEGQSVNDYIDKELCTVHYASFDTAVELVVKAGRGAWLAKADVKSAFRLLPIAPSDYELLGFTFGGQFYYDKCLPMGCSISCSLFEKFSTFLEFKVKAVSDSSSVTHYLDDFVFVGFSAFHCAKLLDNFQQVCAELGVPLADEKTMGPAQVLTFLGLEIDSVKGQIRVPHEKINAMLKQIREVLSKRKISLVGVQSIVGSLNFLCKAIPPGRAFLRRIIALTHGLTRPHHRVRISKGARLDLLTWLDFLTKYNGVSVFMHSEWQSNETLELYTDAAASIGFGAYFRGKWVQGHWPDEILRNPPSIAFLELYPLLVALRCWGPLLAGCKVKFHTDNSAVVHIINKCSSPCPQIMRIVRVFVLECLRFNILFKAVHVPGKYNELADALSRFQMHRFRVADPQAEAVMTELPALTQVW